MSIPVYSTVFAALAGFTGVDTSVVPLGYVAVLRDLDATVGISAGMLITLTGTNGQIIWAWEPGVTTGKVSNQWRGRQVVGPAGTFSITTNAPADVTLSGWLLTAP